MADKEYIEREAALKLFDKVGCYLNPNCLERQKEQIKQLPTADVVEVRCGEWIPEYPTGAFMVRCSLCKTLSSSYRNWNYCPNCGAKMDGKGEGE